MDASRHYSIGFQSRGIDMTALSMASIQSNRCTPEGNYEELKAIPPSLRDPYGHYLLLHERIEMEDFVLEG